MAIWIILAAAAVLHACVVSDVEVKRIREAKDEAVAKFGNA